MKLVKIEAHKDYNINVNKHSFKTSSKKNKNKEAQYIGNSGNLYQISKKVFYLNVYERQDKNLRMLIIVNLLIHHMQVFACKAIETLICPTITIF